MRVFISFAKGDANLAEQLQTALRRNNIEAFSSLDAVSPEDWKRIVDSESADADGYVFLLGAGGLANPELQAEWRWLLRNDFESKKALIPIVYAQGSVPQEMPPFLRSRRPIFTTDFDAAIGELRYLLEHPAETVDRESRERSRVELAKRLSELKDFALSLKQENGRGEAKPR